MPSPKTKLSPARLCLIVAVTSASCLLAWWYLFVFSTRAAHEGASRESRAYGFIVYHLRDREMDLDARGALDRDADGRGEFASLADLMAHPPPAEHVGRNLTVEVEDFNGRLNEAQISKYYLVKVFVPEDPGLAENSWCAVTWPLHYGRGRVKHSFVYWETLGDRSMCLRGRCDKARFSGWGTGPALPDIFVGQPFQSEVRRDIWEPWP